jgi:hypothetical protein
MPVLCAYLNHSCLRTAVLLSLWPAKLLYAHEMFQWLSDAKEGACI